MVRSMVAWKQRTEIQNSDAMQDRSTEVVGSAVAVTKALTQI